MRVFAEEIKGSMCNEENLSIMVEAMTYYTDRIMGGIGPIPAVDTVFVLAALKNITGAIESEHKEAGELADMLLEDFIGCHTTVTSVSIEDVEEKK